jgi:hypothetical protein
MSDDSDWKFRMSLGKVAVVYLNSPTEFTAWHLALRRLVAGYNMVPNLMYSVPQNKYNSLKEVMGKKKSQVKEEPDSEAEAKGSSKFVAVDLSGDDLESEPIAEETKAMMESLGVTPTIDEFFSSTTQFVMASTGDVEPPKEVYFRQEIWTWLDNSLSKGTYKWVTRSIKPVYDIHALYTKVVSLANKATWISHALEFCKIFTMPRSGDIFQYHADLLQQIKVVSQQGESLGIESEVPAWMEQSLLLIAAWQQPQYRKIALEFTMKDEDVQIETLVKELQKQSLLTSHLNQAGGKADRGGRNRDHDSDAQVRLVTSDRDSSGGHPAIAESLLSIPQEGLLFTRKLLFFFTRPQGRKRTHPTAGRDKTNEKKGTENTVCCESEHREKEARNN